MKSYKHSFANYPKKYVGSVVSPHKICLQFSEVVVKNRVAYRDESDLIKLPTTQRALPVTSDGVEINVLAVGTPIEEILELQRDLLKAYAKYGELYSKYYKDNYGKDFKSELKNIFSELEGIMV